LGLGVERIGNRYPILLGVIFAPLFFTNLLTYGGLLLWSVQPVHAILLLLVLMIPACLFSNGLKFHLLSPYVLWCIGFLIICCVSYSALAYGPIEPLKNRILAVVFMLSTYFIFSQSSEAVLVVRWSLVLCVLFGCAMNCYHFANPSSIIPSTSELFVLGRAAGLYINPNQSAAALLVGLILTIGLIRAEFRSWYFVLVAIAVVLTASRAGIAAIFLLGGTFLYTRTLVWAQALRIVVILSVSVFVAVYLLGGTGAEARIDWGEVLTRLDWFTRFGGRADFSQNEREVVARMAFEVFEEHPYFGAGLGSTELWAARSSSHNWYLMAMADFGILGVAVFPLLTIACVGGLKGLFDRQNLPFVVFLLWWANFSHNIVGEYFFMISMSLMAAWSVHRYRGVSPEAQADQYARDPRTPMSHQLE